MHRATVVYVVMILACAAGVWAVLSVGSRLVAPEDLAGKWTLSSSATAGPGVAMAAFGPGMTIDQSGRFFQVSFDNGPRLDLRLDKPVEVLPVLGRQVERMELVAPGWNLRAWGKSGADEWVFWLVGPQDAQSGKWLAKRVLRTFPHSPNLKGAAGTGAAGTGAAGTGAAGTGSSGTGNH